MNNNTAKTDTSLNNYNPYSSINRPLTPYPVFTTTYSLLPLQYHSLPTNNADFQSSPVISVPSPVFTEDGIIDVDALSSEEDSIDADYGD